MVGAEILFVDRQRAAHQRLGLRQPVRGLQQLREVVEVSRDVGMVWPVALLVDRQRAAHQRLGLRQPVGGLQQLREVVEGGGDVRDGRARRRSSMASARRISGSASASRLVAWSNRGEVIEVGRDVGMLGPVAPHRSPAPGASAARPPPPGWYL